MALHSSKLLAILFSGRLAITAAGLAVAYVAWGSLAAALSAIWFPLSLDYAEGIVLQQALLMTGPQAYGDITRYPFIVFHYPPGFHLVTRLVAAFGADIVAVGRIVSIAATLAMAAVVGGLVHATLATVARSARIFGAAMGAGLVLCFFPVSHWMAFARVDMLAIALSLAGLLLVVRARPGSMAVPAAAICFTLAVYTKQTTLAAPLAAIGILAVTSPRDAVRLAAVGLGAALLALAIAHTLTQGGLLRHLVLYNLNSFDAVGWGFLGEFFASHAVLIILGTIALLEGRRRIAARRAGTLRLRDVLRASPALRAFATIVLYLAFSTPLLVMIGKSGASWNYIIEWSCGCAALVGALFGWLAEVAVDRQVQSSRLSRRDCVFLSIALIVQLWQLPDPTPLVLQERELDTATAEDLIATVRAADRPVLSDDMVLLLRAGKQVVWEPFIFAELAALGVWDETRIIELIDGGHFALAITTGERGIPLFDTRWTPAVADALERAFPYASRQGRLLIRRPAGG